ncbi:MAG TPA: A/G-specific adenine glycosylase [Chthoniobacteraceae bacterium]|jgi:A/G-specific adenine glycosylase|nr:A/G-specific adenine glycosylase [Chthoniobacteraceae bacterium]
MRQKPNLPHLVSASSTKLQRSAPARDRFREQLGAWFLENGRDLPWRRTRDPYAILVSELMLQQTQVATVQPYFERWLARFPDFRTLAAAEESEVLHAWQGLGYYARARNLHRAARHVVERHAGALPDDSAAIAALPGVGRYTQGAIASFAFDRPAAAVDANIARVLARLFAIEEPIDSTAGARRVWEAAELLLPRTGGGLHTSGLMELGALLCTPRGPQCLVCPVRVHCAGAGAPELFPVKKAPRAQVGLDENCAWIVKRGAVLLEQQTGARWRGLWKLPPLAGGAPGDPPLWKATYPFTHHRVTLRVYSSGAPRKLGTSQRWFTPVALKEAALPSPHRRAVDALAAMPRLLNV